jgi:hypothetical protein
MAAIRPARGAAGPPQPTAFPVASRSPSASPSRNRKLRAPAVTAPVLHQKRSQRDATNAIESAKSSRKINASDTCPAAHNGLVAGSSPAGPTNVAPCLLGILLDLRTMIGRLSYAGTCCQRRERCSRRLQAALPRRPTGVFVDAQASSRGPRDAADSQAEPKRPERCR